MAGSPQCQSGPHLPTPSGGLVAAPTPSRRGCADGPSWCVCRGRLVAQPKTAECANPGGLGIHLAITASTSRRPQGEGRQRTKGRVPLERQNPHSQNTRTLRPWQICGAETKPARFASGLWVDPPRRVGRLGLVGYKRGGVRERDEACGTRSVKEAQSRLLSLLQIAGTRG